MENKNFSVTRWIQGTLFVFAIGAAGLAGCAHSPQETSQKAVATYLDKQAQALSSVAAPERTPDGLQVNLKGDDYFESGSAVLKAPVNGEVAKIGQVLSEYPDNQIRIEGYTDSQGRRGQNQLLSHARAEAVKNVLLQNGVKPQQLVSQGMGDTKPIASNKSADGRAQNRRVELHISVPEGATAKS